MEKSIVLENTEDTLTVDERTMFILKIISGERILKEVGIKLINEISLTDLKINYDKFENPQFFLVVLSFFEKIKAWHRIEEVRDIIENMDNVSGELLLYDFIYDHSSSRVLKTYIPRVNSFLRRISKDDVKNILISKEPLRLVKKYRLKKIFLKILNNIPPYTIGEKILHKRLMNEDVPFLENLISIHELSDTEKNNFNRFVSERGKYLFAQENRDLQPENSSASIPSKETEEESSHSDDDSPASIAKKEAIALGAVFCGIKKFEVDGETKPFSTHYFNDEGEEIYHFGNTLEDIIEGYIGTPVESVKWSESELEELNELFEVQE